MRTSSSQARFFFLDLEWWVESHGRSSMGRGLELTVRGARLPITCHVAFVDEVVLHVSMPSRERMFKARASATMAPSGWLLRFLEVAPDDLQLLGHTLISEFGVLALPELRPERETAMSLR